MSDRGPLVKSAYDLEEEYRKYVRSADSNAVDLGCWLPSLRDHVRPMLPGEVVVVMADTGHGKTAILQNIAVACRNADVLLFELELPGVLCFERFSALTNKMTQAEVEQDYKTGHVLNKGPFDHVYTCDQSGLTIEKISEIVDEYQRSGEQYGIVMIDYMGLISGVGSRYERLSDIAEKVKVLAKESNTVVVASTQVHRKGDEYPHELFIHDAKDSGSIENSAGLLLGAWKEPKSAEDIENCAPDYLCVKILKNTKGEPGHMIRCVCDWSRMRISEEAPRVIAEPWVSEMDEQLEGGRALL